MITLTEGHICLSVINGMRESKLLHYCAAVCNLFALYYIISSAAVTGTPQLMI